MISVTRKWFGNLLLEGDAHERRKVVLLTIIYFLVISAYTVAQGLKDSIFLSVVGREYVPLARLASLFVLIPAVLLYSKVVDNVRRYQLLAIYSIAFGVLGLIFSVVVGHSTIGIGNTDASPYRIFGWLFYFFVEGYTPFVVSVMWAFVNSVSSPESAKKSYGTMVAGSKLGGMLGAGIPWLLFALDDYAGAPIAGQVFTHQLVLAVASTLLLTVPLVIYHLIRVVPGKYLHGYEAAYQFEKHQKQVGKEKTGLFSGLVLLLKYPYVLGIFGVVYFYEVINTVLGYMRLGAAEEYGVTLAGKGAYLFQSYFLVHSVGFVISLFGTKWLMSHMGERICLILIPVVTGFGVLYYLLATSPSSLIFAFTVMKAVNYAFSYPVRESLYIPTAKAIKFKSKSWIDAFGSKFAKVNGSSYVLLMQRAGPGVLAVAEPLFFVVIIGLWTVTAYGLGRRFERSVVNQEVIGSEEEATQV
jgi:AAA family ATP:ADP antiporter